MYKQRADLSPQGTLALQVMGAGDFWTQPLGHYLEKHNSVKIFQIVSQGCVQKSLVLGF